MQLWLRSLGILQWDLGEDSRYDNGDEVESEVENEAEFEEEEE